VNEAIRLVNVSKASVDEPVEEGGREGRAGGGGGGGGGGAAEATTRIYGIINGRAKEQGFVLMDEAREAVTNAGFSEDQLRATLQEYLDLNVWALNVSHTRIDIVGR
jgi:hypothetical protein